VPPTYQTCADQIFVRKANRRWQSKEPLDKRAWTLQENILSPRTIHYTSSELKWDCQKRLAFESELEPGHDSYLHMKRDFLAPLQTLQHEKLSEIEPGAIFHNPYTAWYTIVGNYVNRALTIPSDKLPAISGVAREIH
jgi:hypothetical protein